jgi:uncharacterized protein (TIGR02996 family)
VPIPAAIAAVVREPDDLDVRLIAADQFDEIGDPRRAAFVRAQVDIERRLAIAHTEGEINALLGGETPEIANWSPELAALASERLIADRGFARGFVEHVTMAAEDFAVHADEVLERAPIRFLTLTAFTDQTGAACALGPICGLRLARMISRPAIDLRRDRDGRYVDEAYWPSNVIGDRELAILCDDRLDALEVLDLSGHVISTAGWVRLVRAAPRLCYGIGAPPRTVIAGYDDTDDAIVEPNPIVAEVEAAVGRHVPWFPVASPYLDWWPRMRWVRAAPASVSHNLRRARTFRPGNAVARAARYLRGGEPEDAEIREHALGGRRFVRAHARDRSVARRDDRKPGERRARSTAGGGAE